MRTSDIVFAVSLLGVVLGLSPAVSFDGTRTPEGAPVMRPSAVEQNPADRAAPLAVVPVAPLSSPLAASPRAVPTPFEAYRSGTLALRQGHTRQAVAELEFAARQGVPGAIWKLGRMYADGDGVDVNKARAFEYFSHLTNRHGDDSQGTPNARFVANAFVSLGQYYLDGVPEAVEQNPKAAFDMFHYAAAVYADPVAQYRLGRLYLRGHGAPKDPMQAARWLRLSALKGEYHAQALLGSILFKGDVVPRQAAHGLFWLIVAKDSASGQEDQWITEAYAQAIAQATDNERERAYKYLENWLKFKP
jgi:exopolysaccharide production negative regulator